MRRIRNYRYTYSERPSNCPMCGSRTVHDLDASKAMELAVQGDNGEELVPRWYCETCEVPFFPSVRDEMKDDLAGANN